MKIRLTPLQSQILGASLGDTPELLAALDSVRPGVRPDVVAGVVEALKAGLTTQAIDTGAAEALNDATARTVLGACVEGSPDRIAAIRSVPAVARAVIARQGAALADQLAGYVRRTLKYPKASKKKTKKAAKK